MFPIRDNSKRARQIIVIFWILFALAIINIACLCWVIYSLNASSTLNVPDIWIEYIVIALRVAGISVMVVQLLTVIYFIRWFRRAYYNLHVLPNANLRFRHAWAAGSWFIPVASNFLPFLIMFEIWEKTQQAVRIRLGRIRSSGIVGVWWAGCVVMNLTGYYSVWSAFFNPPKGEDVFDSVLFEIAQGVFAVLMIIVTIILIRRTHKFELALWQELNEPSDSVFAVSSEEHTKENERPTTINPSV